MQLPSPDLVREQAYLVSRGVRPMALLGTCGPRQAAEARGLLLVHGQAYDVLPFVLRAGKSGGYDFGFAAEGWALELYAWSRRAPGVQRERIEGLLLGYGAAAIARFEASAKATAAGVRL